MTDNEIYESNLQHFHIVRRYGNKSQCTCPAHSDKQASLTITQGNKGTLFCCYIRSQCSGENKPDWGNGYDESNCLTREYSKCE